MRTHNTLCRRDGPAKALLTSCLTAFVPALLTSVSLTASSSALVSPSHQDPVKPSPAKPAEAKAADDLLDAEREKLRMKDVEGWKRLQVKSLDQVLDVKKATQPLELPASVTEAEKAKMVDLLQRAKSGGGGARTGRALREFEKLGYPALLFLINQLRDIDYKDPADALFGMQINMTLQSITLGVNAGYVAIDIGEPMDPRKAQWNAQTVPVWLGSVKKQWPTRESFDEYVTKRKLKKEAELEGDKGEPDAKKPPDEKKKG